VDYGQYPSRLDTKNECVDKPVCFTSDKVTNYHHDDQNYTVSSCIKLSALMEAKDGSPLVSIITLNYNQATVTASFLASTQLLQYPRIEILVCDMASAENITDYINEGDYQNTKLLFSKENLGFAGGNNWGMRQAKGDFIFIVNNDTIVTPHLIEKLLAPFSINPLIGVTSPTIKFFDQPNIIQYAGFNDMNKYTGRTSTIGEGEVDNGQHNIAKPSFAAHGCAMMVKREVIEKTGMFPEKFFLYYEEWDWSTRIRAAGYTIWHAADATIYHKESATVGKKNPLKTYYHTRNRILYMRRHTTWYQFLFFVFYFGAIVVPKNIITLLLKREFTVLKNFLKGVAWHFYSSSHSKV
jgi:GT2 family glycosyltransferase